MESKPSTPKVTTITHRDNGSTTTTQGVPHCLFQPMLDLSSLSIILTTRKYPRNHQVKLTFKSTCKEEKSFLINTWYYSRGKQSCSTVTQRKQRTTKKIQLCEFYNLKFWTKLPTLAKQKIKTVQSRISTWSLLKKYVPSTSTEVEEIFRNLQDTTIKITV